MDKEEMYRVNEMMEEMEKMNLPKEDPYQKSRQEQITEAIELMEKGLDFNAISEMTELTRYEIDQLYAIYRPTLDEGKTESIEESVKFHH